MSDEGQKPADLTPPADNISQSPGPAPVDSGTTSEQRDVAAIVGEVMPRPQLSQVADSVPGEATGLVTLDPEFLKSWGAQRLLTSYANEQAVTSLALRKDLSETQARERKVLVEVGDIKERLAVATTINNTEKKLRTPRAVFSVLGVAVAGFGFDKIGDGDYALGIAATVVGLGIVGATYLVAPSERGKP